MKIRDLSELAARNLREALLRNSLTTLGIGVGVASLVAMLSLGVGLQQLASKRLTNSGLFNSVIVMSRENVRGGFGRRAMSQGVDTSLPPRRLDEEAREQFGRIANVAEVYPEVRFPTQIQYKGNPYPTVVAGVPQSSRDSGAYDGILGAFFSGPEAHETILQIELAKQLSSNPSSLIGQDITLNYAERQALAPSAGSGISGGFSVVPREDKLRIVGIIDTEPTTGAGGFGQVRLMIPLDVAEKFQVAQTNDLRAVLGGNAGRQDYPSLTVLVNDASQVQGVEDSIKAMGFAAYSLLDASRNLRLVFVVFDLLLGAFGSLALVVASLGIVNTLVMAILERRREIGILKALGASDRDVKSLFFSEAGCMGLLGGVFGVTLGWLIGRAITFGTNVYLHRQDLPSIELTSVPLWMVIGAIAFSVGVSLIAGLYPASRAAQLNPVEALRYE